MLSLFHEHPPNTKMSWKYSYHFAEVAERAAGGFGPRGRLSLAPVQQPGLVGLGDIRRLHDPGACLLGILA